MGRFFDEYMPHGHCYLWMPEVLWLNVLSDAAIVIAYFSIPILLLIFISRRPNFPFGKITVLFSVFILSCGLTHAMSIWTVWNGNYGIHGLLKFGTALASMATAIALIPVIPRALAYRSPDEYEATLAELRSEITERKRAEAHQARLQEDLVHVSRLGTMNEMSASLAHELNQPLAAITLYCQAAMALTKNSKGPIDQKVIGHLQEVHDQAQRAGDGIKELRKFVQKGDTEKADADINDVIEEATRLIEPQARDCEIDIVFSLTKKDSVAMINRVQIAQVVVNLIRNSIEAIEISSSPERRISIATDVVGDDIRVTIEDTGPGLSLEAQRRRAFESDKRGGMGLGLSISRTIIEAHDGTLELDRTYKNGARFSFTISRSGQQVD